MATKKATARKSVKKTEIKESSVQPAVVSKTAPKISKKVAIAILAAIILGILLYIFRGFFIAATVNGEPISRLALVQEMEGQYGKTTLDTFVAKTVILQEMKKKNITVSDSEVNAEIQKAKDSLKSQGLTLDEALKQKKMTMATLIDQIRIQKMVEKLFGKDIKVTSEQIDKYMKDNEAIFPPVTEASEAAKLRETVKQQLGQQQLSQKFQAWLTPLQQKAKIQYFVSY